VSKKFKTWDEYPVGTKAYAIMGGHWIKVKCGGWKWCTGDTFPTPGGDWCRIEEPSTIDKEAKS
jgi:hypothetical protein